MQLKRIFIFVVFFVSKGYSQKPISNTHANQYTTENGLPSNLIRGLQWDDRTNFLWIITEGGLVRFNGVDFKSYNKEKVSPLAPEKSVYAVKNNLQNIFISDGSGNLFEIINNNPKILGRLSASKSFINHFFVTVSDTFLKTKINQEPVFFSAFEKVVPLDDTSCLINFNNLLYYFSVSLKKPAQILSEFNSITKVFKIGNECFFMSAGNKIFLLNTNTFSTSIVGLDNNFKTNVDFFQNSNQLFWQNGMISPILISKNNAHILIYENSKIHLQFISDKVPTDANIHTVNYSEKNNLLFIGTESKGVVIISPDFAEPKKRQKENINSKNAYFSQIILNDKTVLTNEGDIIGDYEFPRLELPIRGKFSNRISSTNGNLLWYNSKDLKTGNDYLYQYNYSTKKTIVYDKIKVKTQVVESNGETYFANNVGIGLMKADSIFYLYKYPANIPNLNTYDFTEISPGVLVIAGCSGLLRYNISINKLDTIFNIPNACFGSIWKYKDYIFWGSYGYGYFIYHNGVIKEMPLDKNKYLQYCHCFVPDNYGYCWISTNRGLLKVKLDDIIRNFENERSPIYYHYFGKNDGLEMTELNGGCTPCAVKLYNETISYPTMDGLLWVNTKEANPLMPNGEIFIDEILVDSKNLSFPDFKDFILPSNTEEIKINLGFNAWCKKENLYIDYQINDTLNWKELNPEDNTFIQFNNLPSGKYVLRIRKLNGFGINNYTFKTLVFTISTPWYKQFWFYFIVIFSLIGLAILFYKNRTRNLKRRQLKLEKQIKEKTEELQFKNNILEKGNNINTRLISIISHDIITPLKFLNVAGKNLVENKSLMSEELKDETIKEITFTSKELQMLSTNILNWIKYQNKNRRLIKEEFNVHEMVNQVFGVLQSSARQNKIELQNNIDISLILYQYFEPLKILVYNLLTNAMNFTNKGIIEVSGKMEGEVFIIKVKDEGIGMTQEQIANIMADHFIVSSANLDNKKGNGLGYLIIKDLLKMIDGTILIESEKNVGTTVSVKISIFN